ncbi:DUF6183 family protein [Streptomyces flaveus]|uniref:Uncharacterized protein n=1 Tax=Streptomyces flaveus TaxID=66370 RepID=A0A917QPZ0_9ACTN|nr:DUF6183 family protein [Streptomyces flaveus]GGK62928.1 hypothetical protein GCM10010094_24690 [Streptomyces flaveus]
MTMSTEQGFEPPPGPEEESVCRVCGYGSPLINKEAPGHATAATLATADAAYTMFVGTAIDREVSAGRFAWVGGLGEEIAAWAAAGKDVPSQHGQILDRILHALAAHAGRDSLRTLLRLPAYLGTVASGRLRAERWLAALVADGHWIEDIVELVFAEEADSVHSREFAACLLHELVLTSGRVEEYPTLCSFAGELVDEGHPLAALPLSLLPAERGLRRPPNADDTWTWFVPPTPLAVFDDPELHASPPMRQRTADIDMTEISTDAVAEVMGAAVRHWCSESNGLVAAQEFWSPDPVAPDDFAAVFERLPLTPWLEGESTAQLYASTSDSVLRVLLSAAVRSSAYGFGVYGAYGRLATWRSLRGLTGAPADAPLARVAELVEQAEWFRIATTSDWFHEVAWDLAVAALRPGRQEIAVLAATDTD